MHREQDNCRESPKAEHPSRITIQIPSGQAGAPLGLLAPVLLDLVADPSLRSWGAGPGGRQPGSKICLHRQLALCDLCDFA